jgi:glycosyltransferase involved in cell wall biosynthesis
MRVLYFTRDYTPHDHRFLSALAETEHEVHYLRLEKRGPERESRAIPPRIKRIQWEGGDEPAQLRHGLKLLLGVRRVIREIKPDLIHAGPIQNVALLAALSGFKPLITMSWGYDLLIYANRSPIMRWLTKTVLKETTLLFCDNDAVAQQAITLGFDREHIIQFPWGVDLDHFSPGDAAEMRARRGWEHDFVILFNRAWEPLYGVDTFVKAFCRAAEQREDLRLLLLGTGSLAQIIRQTIQGAGLAGAVHLGGHVRNEDLPDYYRCADLYVSASLTDGTSVSLLEALACGVPVLVSDIPGNQQWVSDHVGATFSVGDVDALTRKILDMAEMRDQLVEISRNARELAVQKANWKQSIQTLLRGYDIAVNA